MGPETGTEPVKRTTAPDVDWHLVMPKVHLSQNAHLVRVCQHFEAEVEVVSQTDHFDEATNQTAPAARYALRCAAAAAAACHHMNMVVFVFLVLLSLCEQENRYTSFSPASPWQNTLHIHPYEATAVTCPDGGTTVHLIRCYNRSPKDLHDPKEVITAPCESGYGHNVGMTL